MFFQINSWEDTERNQQESRVLAHPSHCHRPAGRTESDRRWGEGDMSHSFTQQSRAWSGKSPGVLMIAQEEGSP